MRILLLEDDKILSQELVKFLKLHEFECDAVYDGLLLVKQFKISEYDIVLLDVNVPGRNGLEVCKELRAHNGEIPIMMLTAFGEIDDKVTAFNEGADDYLVKPFHLEELMVRIKSLLRRKHKSDEPRDKIIHGDMEMDLSDMRVWRDGKEIHLSPKEFKLLRILAQANGRVISKNQIADSLWDYHIETNQNTIEVYINFLRNKLDKNHETKLIHTRVGYGYYLAAE